MSVDFGSSSTGLRHGHALVRLEAEGTAEKLSMNMLSCRSSMFNLVLGKCGGCHLRFAPSASCLQAISADRCDNGRRLLVWKFWFMLQQPEHAYAF